MSNQNPQKDSELEHPVCLPLSQEEQPGSSVFHKLELGVTAHSLGELELNGRSGDTGQVGRDL